MKDKTQFTIYDIAKALDISPSTVSRGLKDHPLIKKETKERIRKKSQEMGYQHNIFASNLRRNKTNTIGVVVPRLDSYFMSKVIAGIELTANKHGYNIIINQSEESESKEIKCIQTMYNSRVDGLLLSIATDTTEMKHFDILYDKNIPVVFFDRTEDHKESVSVMIDNQQAAFEIVDHLAKQNCKRIMHIAGKLNRNVYADRLEGYKKALKKNKLAYNSELVIEGKLNEEGGQEVADIIKHMEVKPDAVFASNDKTAVALISQLKKNGIRIPDDIAVAGFNNDPISSIIGPNLTTINYPGREIGEIAASTLIDQIDKKKSAKDLESVCIKHNLIIRESSLKNNI
jgi:LacI family transcriptional regulator